MQITPVVAEYSPQLMESDALSLSPDFVLVDGSLIDTLAGAHLGLMPIGRRLAKACLDGITASELRHKANQQGVSDVQLAELLGLLNLTGGLVRRRKAAAWPQAWLQLARHFMMGIRYCPLSWRKRATFWYVLGASFGRACQ